MVYTTNVIEALNSRLRRAVRAWGHFPTDDAALKLLFLVLNRSEKAWKMGSDSISGFAAHWTTGDDPDELAAIDGFCWTDEGAGEGDHIRLYDFMWVDDQPDQVHFETLMLQACSAIDRHISARFSG